jgi:hypothetical protein
MRSAGLALPSKFRMRIARIFHVNGNSTYAAVLFLWLLYCADLHAKFYSEGLARMEQNALPLRFSVVEPGARRPSPMQFYKIVRKTIIYLEFKELLYLNTPSTEFYSWKGYQSIWNLLMRQRL